MEEPSVLDYLKSLLKIRGAKKISFDWNNPEIPAEVSPSQMAEASDLSVELAEAPSPAPEASASTTIKKGLAVWPFLLVGSMTLAVVAQMALEPPRRDVVPAVVMYLIAAGLLVAAYLTHHVELPQFPKEAEAPLSLVVRWTALLISIPFLGLSFFFAGGNRFTAFNVFLLFVGIAWIWVGLWIPGEGKWLQKTWQNLRGFASSPHLSVRITGWTLLVFAVGLLAVFFRFYMLDKVPGEMFSDHAEKLLDVSDVLNGQYSIFFPRNTGREFFQMYLSAAVAILAGTGLSFMTLKIGTALCGLLTLPFVYLVGKEVGNRWVGLIAMLLAGVAYWPNVISRVALRFTLYPFFVAPMLFFFLRGIRKQSRNDFMLAGVFLGLGLNGYSPMRIVPFILILAVLIYIIHPQARGKRWQTIFGLVVLGFIAFVICLPLIRYVLSDPEMFGYRALTRLSTTERAYPGPVWLIFLNNIWNALMMFFWSNGNIWVHSIPNRPALDIVTAAALFLGVVLLLVRYIQKHHWRDLFLLLAIPLFMLPSILSLAFPDENPSLNRTGAALVPVFVIAAMGMEAIISNLYKKAGKTGRVLVVVWAVFLFGWAINNNYDLVFKKYNDQFMAGAWNTSDIGHVIRSFADSVGTPDTAYVVPFPYWVDTRLVGINAGYPQKDYALWPENFNTILDDHRTKLFILKEEDSADLQTLKDMYPQATATLHQAQREGKNFWVMLVPAQQ